MGGDVGNVGNVDGNIVDVNSGISGGNSSSRSNSMSISRTTSTTSQGGPVA